MLLLRNVSRNPVSTCEMNKQSIFNRFWPNVTGNLFPLRNRHIYGGQILSTIAPPMKKINIFLASSNELQPERERFEMEIYRKCKAWFGKGIFLHLDIWEDLAARMSHTRSQDEYNKFVQSADLFVLLAYTKVGMYTDEEFEKAFGQFQSTQKPYIFTYFKTSKGIVTEPSLADFQQKLKALGHFYCQFADSNDLWNQFNKELERLENDAFRENKWVNDQSGTHTYKQQAQKIYNIEKIDQANFS